MGGQLEINKGLSALRKIMIKQKYLNENYSLFDVYTITFNSPNERSKV